jgi:hypothetical protein
MEFLVGLLLGLFAGVITAALFSGRGRVDIVVENEQLREGLRYVQRVVRRDPQISHLAVYIEALLSEDAGA